MVHVRRYAIAPVLLVVLLSWPADTQAQAPAFRWFKGNTHTHTVNSDGDSTPDEVVRWYREARYHFLVITDHDFSTPVEGLNAIHAADRRFLVIPGEEVSDTGGDKPVHLNLLGTSRLVKAQGGATSAQALQRDLDAMRQVDGALVQINHPNFGWALGAADLAASKGAHLLEIHNGHPMVNNLGGGGVPSAEAMWDAMLSAGQKVFAVASDDLHEIKRPGVRQAAGPGRGWVVVRAADLSAANILSALSRGDFYASTGVELSEVTAAPGSLTVAVKEAGSTRYTIQFIGKGGRVVKEAVSSPAVYALAPDEPYVRAKVVDSNGWCAWTQPVWSGQQK